MNEKQARFCSEYVATRNATQAAKAAGYSEKTAYSQGHKLLKHAEIQKKITELSAEVYQANFVTAEELVSGVADIFRNGQSDAAKLKAAELLGRQLGVFTDNGGITAPVTVVIQYDYGDKN